MMFWRGTEPQTRESHDWARLSPIMKYWPFGTFQTRAGPVSRRFFRMYGSFSLRPSM